MPTALPLSTAIYPLAIIKPPAAGSPLSLTSNFTDLPTAQQQFAVLAIRANPANGSYIYILNNGSAADTTSFRNVLDVIIPGGQFLLNLVPSQIILAAQYFIDVAHAGDSAIPMVAQI